MTAKCFIGAWGLMLFALIVCAETKVLANETDVMKQSDITRVGTPPMRLLAQAVTAIEVRPEADLVTVAIAGDGQLFPEANFLDESRLIIDIPAVSSTLRRSVIRADHYLLKKIRVGHHADKIRLVFDVPEKPIYSMVREANKVLITLKPSESRALSAMATKVHTDESVSILPRSRKPTLEARDRVIRKAARIVRPTQSQFRMQRAQMTEESTSAEKEERSDDLVIGQTRFVGRRISLDFQQADITNILRLIAEVSGFNIVVGEGVKAKVTMKMVNVPWDQALDMLLKMNGLGMFRQGSIVWVDSLANLSKQQDEEARARDSKTKAEPVVDRVFYIRHIPAQELMQSLRQNLSPRGRMQFNNGSNALVVQDTESQLAVMKQLVEGLDLEVPQVQIEARIVQADTVYARGMGIQWGFKTSQFNSSDFHLIGNPTGGFAQAGGTGATTIAGS
jgi:type IV pilus assembly protein PilQ